MKEENFAPHPKDNEPWDVGIIGSGPASFTAGIYTTRGAASTLILGGANWGGQLMLTTTVDNYPGFPQGVQGPELMANMKTQAERFGAKFVTADVTDVDLSSKPFKLTADGKTYLAKTVIVATGANTVWLGVPGEEKLLGRGVSSCAPCDAPFFKDKRVAVVGGGDSAMEEALVLTKYATQVTIIHRRDEFRASAAMQARVKSDPKIKIIWDTQVTEMLGDQKLEKLKLKNLKTNVDSELELDGVFVAVGHSPSTKLFTGKLDLDEKGFVVKKPAEGYSMMTSVNGVFVAGDVHDIHYKQAVTAAAFGCMASLEVLKYLDNQS